jgi:hypothetical protein
MTAGRAHLSVSPVILKVTADRKAARCALVLIPFSVRRRTSTTCGWPMVGAAAGLVAGRVVVAAGVAADLPTAEIEKMRVSRITLTTALPRCS